MIASRADPPALAEHEAQPDADAVVLADCYAALLAAIRRNRAARLAADPQRGEPGEPTRSNGDAPEVDQ
jgi:hypothetical protein